MRKAAPRVIVCAWLLLLTGCYRFPTDEDCSVIPITNNRDITCEKGSSLLPQANI